MRSLTNDLALVPPLNPARCRPHHHNHHNHLHRHQAAAAAADDLIHPLQTCKPHLTRPSVSYLIADINTVHDDLVAYLNNHPVHDYSDSTLYTSSPSIVTIVDTTTTPLSVLLEGGISDSDERAIACPESFSPAPSSPLVPTFTTHKRVSSHNSSSDDEGMLFAMTVDAAAAAAAALVSSSSESSRPSSPVSSVGSGSKPQPLQSGKTGLLSSHKSTATVRGDESYQQQQLRDLLLSTSSVARVCLVSPRAGPFEGRFVALVTSTPVHPPNNDNIALIDDAEREGGRRRILALKTAVNEWGSDWRRPDVWILLQSMATNDDGEPDARKLQTWVQNLSEEKEKRILDIQVTKQSGRATTRTTPPSRPALPESPVQPIADLRHQMGIGVVGSGGGQDFGGENGDALIPCEEYYPLSVMQQLFFRTSLGPSLEVASVNGDDFRFTQSILVRIKENVELADIEAAISVLVARHAMLRAQFRLTTDGWAQTTAPESDSAYRFEHRYVENDEGLLSCIDDAQTSLNIFSGPVFAVEYIRNVEDQQMLYLVAHHLVVDFMSWRILLRDLDEMLRKKFLVPPPSMPFTTWTDIKSYENKNRSLEPALPFVISPANLAYWDLKEKSNLYGDTTQLTFSLLQKEALSLQKTCNEVFRTESADIFLAALLHSFHQTFPERDVPTVWKQEHGRDVQDSDSNMDQTVGWFNTLCPIHVPVKNADLIHLVKTVKDIRKIIPENGTTFFHCNFTAERSTAASLLPVEIMFNCVETMKQLEPENGILEPLASPDRRVRSLACHVGPALRRIALFEVSIAVNDDGARVEFSYNANSKHQGRIVSWMNKFETSIMEVISRLRALPPELTLSDVPLLDVTYAGLSKLMSSRLVDIGMSDVRNVETVLPVNQIQEEILTAQARDRDCFRISRTCELKTPDGSLIDPNKLCDAWETLVCNHDIMRSIFTDTVSDKGLFDQVVLKRISPAMLFIDSDDPMETLSTLPPMSSAPAQPRHRLSVSRSHDKTFLRIDCSQAVCDVIGVANLIEQLRQLYMGKESFAFEPPLPRPPSRPGRHIVSLDASRSLDVWRANLSGATPCIFPHLAVQDHGRLETHGISLDIGRYQLSQFCAENQLSESSVIQLAWAFVVRTYVGEDRVVFGFQYAGREESLLSQGVGSMAVTAPCMVDFSPVCTVLDALWRLELTQRDSKTTEIPTLAEIEHSLGIQGQRLFNTCVTYQDVYDTVLSDSDSESNIWEPHVVSNSLDANCDLSLCVTLQDDRIQADVSYACLSPDQLHNVMNTFQRALQVIINTPGQPLSQTDLFTEHDLQQIMYPDWEPEQVDTKLSACLHQLILGQCAARPYEPAIYAWDGELSYQQVEVNVIKLATYLVGLGVGPKHPVPVVLERSRWTPIIMLAVMQAGSCFVCLDAQDMAVVDSMISQLRAPLVVATEGAYKHVSRLIKDCNSINCVSINETLLSSLPPPTAMFSQEPSPRQAACAFLMPGPEKSKDSPRGVPKGVFYTHESLSSLLSVQGPALKIHSGSRVLQLNAYTIDVAIVEVLGTMVHGGCVCIPSALERHNDLEGTIARMDITWTYMTTVLSRKINPSMVPNLQTICFRTRTLDEDTFSPWLGERDILLAYGASVVCPLAISIFNITREEDSSIIAPPLLGRFLILNPEDPKKLMPLGAVGELAIDSPIVTPHKYLHGQPLVDPATIESANGQRKWRYLRTGHRVRYLDRGHVRFLAPMRGQTSINDSPAMNAAAEKHIRQSLGGDVDVALEPITTKDGVKCLAAFLEFGDGEYVGPSELNKLSKPMRSKLAAAKWLAETCLLRVAASSSAVAATPPHPVPTVFIPVRQYPLSTSLKIHRRKLQKMVSPYSCSELLELPNVPFSSQPHFTGIQSKPLPLTQTEEKMRLIWSAVLGVVAADIKITDSFFDAGGDNFLASRLAISCRQNGYDVSVRKIFGGSTLTDICQSLEVGNHHQNHKQRAAPPSKTTLHAKKTSLPKPSITAHKLPGGADHGFIKLIVAPQLGISWNEVTDVAEASSHQLQCLEPSLYGPRSDIRGLIMRFNGSLIHQRVQDACEALTQLHPTLRTAFVVHDCELFQVAVDSFRADFHHEMTTASSSSSLDDMSRLVMEEYQRETLQLRTPATEFTFLDAGSQGGRLIVRFSCAQVSETTVPRLVQDFVKLYEHPAGELERTTFFDYTRALRGSRYKDSISHWKRRLEKSKMTQVVSHSKPVPPASEVKSVEEQVKVSSLAEFSVTFDSVLKAAWAVVLASLSATSDVVFGEVVEGHRLKLETDVDVSSIAGPMENVVPIRVRFPILSSSPLQLLQLIQNDAVESLPFEALGAQKIVHECTNWENWARFSSVVRHRSRVPVDGTTTLNIENTTFTYNLVLPSVRDVPDLFVTSTMMASDKVSLSIEYPSDRVPDEFAETAMRHLVEAVETIACYDTISQPILQPSCDYEMLQSRVLLEKPEPDVTEPSFTHCLTSEQRNDLQQFLVSTWHEMLSPATQDLPESVLLSSRFYDISGTILPAYLIAERLTQDLRKIDIEGIHTVRVTAAQLISAPTIMDQMALITRRMHSAGFLRGKPGRSKKISASRRQHQVQHQHGKNSAHSPSNWALLSSKTRGFRRFRQHNNGGPGSMKDFSNRAGDWVKSRVNLSKEKSSVVPEAADARADHMGWEVVVPLSVPQDGITAMNKSRGIETVPEAAVEIGTSAVIVGGGGGSGGSRSGSGSGHQRSLSTPESLTCPDEDDDGDSDDWSNEVGRALAATAVSSMP